MICSLECTYCVRCATQVLHGKCPNCEGALSARPKRAGKLLPKHPASNVRILNPGGCHETPTHKPGT